MKEIKMLVNNKIDTYQVTYECAGYIFCECNSSPEKRGFFTTDFVNQNKQ